MVSRSAQPLSESFYLQQSRATCGFSVARPSLFQPIQRNLYCTASAAAPPPSTSSAAKAKNITFQYQDELPRLPIPELNDTLSKYRHYLAPLISTRELQITDSYIEAFKGQAGKKLHKSLEELNETVSTSWIEGFWDTMYLELRMPIPINVNPYFTLIDPVQPYNDPAKAQTERASALVLSAFRYQQLIRRKQLEPDMDGKKPLCMYQYSRLLGTSRIPRWARDELQTYLHARHIIVLRNNRMFRVDIMDETGGAGKHGYEALLNREQIQARLDKIIEEADKLESYPDIGILTTEDRNKWAELNGLLTSTDPANEKSINAINTALFILCLDDTNTTDPVETGKIMLHSNSNRWYDKLQLIVFQNGLAGVNMEHSPYDGHTVISFMHSVYEDSNNIKNIPLPESAAPSDALLNKAPQVLEWAVPAAVEKGIEQAHANFKSLVDSTELVPLQFTEYGKEQIKRQFKASPDAFVQMAYQLAYYRQYGKAVSTYESCMVKQFLHGRTETIRSVTPESVELCRKFDVAKGEETRRLIDAAVAAHVATSGQCKNGKGQDRHLFALLQLAKQRQQRESNYLIPELFQDPSYSKYMSNILSTSNCGGDTIGLFGFGAVHSKGLGVGYVLKDNEMVFTVSSFSAPSAQEFRQHLIQSLRDLAEVAKANPPAPAPAAAAATSTPPASS